VRRAYQSDTDVANIGFEAAVQFVAILDGTIAVLLAVLQIIKTYLDIGEKLVGIPFSVPFKSGIF
jgi:hypothetical protein